MPLSLQPENGHTLFFFYLCIIFYLYNICCFPPSHPTRRCNIHPAMPYFSAALYVMRCILLPLNSFLFFLAYFTGSSQRRATMCRRIANNDALTRLDCFFFWSSSLDVLREQSPGERRSGSRNGAAAAPSQIAK